MFTAAVATLGLVTAVAACGDDEEEPAASGASTTATTTQANTDKPVNIAYLVATAAAGYPQGMITAAEAKAKEVGATMQVFDAQFDPGKQVAQCQDAVTSGKFDAIVALPAASPPMVACARAAEKAKIPLISTNTPIGTDLASGPPTVPGVTAQVLVPAETAFGKEPGDGAHDLLTNMCAEAEKSLGGECNIGFIVGVKALALTAAAEKNVTELAKEKGWKIAGTCEGGYQRQGGLKCMQDLLQKDKDINVLMSLSDDMALGAEGALKAAGKTPGEDILVGTQGGSVVGIENIFDAKWYGSILSLAEPEGAIPVELAARAVRGETIEDYVNPNEATDKPLVLDQLNKEEVGQFPGQFKA
jgi:ribose transport system substrate-binding protein